MRQWARTRQTSKGVKRPPEFIRLCRVHAGRDRPRTSIAQLRVRLFLDGFPYVGLGLL